MENQLLFKLKEQGPFCIKQAKRKGISSRMLHYYAEKGVLIRLKHDLYAFPEHLSFDFESLVKLRQSIA